LRNKYLHNRKVDLVFLEMLQSSLGGFIE